MAIYLRGNQWWIEFRYKKKRYREAVAPDKNLAIDVLAKRRVEIRENKFFPEKQKHGEKRSGSIIFHDFAKQYLQWSIANKKSSAKKTELSMMRVLDRTFGEKNLQDITSWNVEEWKIKRRKKVKPATVNRELAVLKTFFKKAVEWQKCNENPTKGVKLFKGVTQRLRYLLPDEVQLLISNCMAHLKPIVTVAVHTGMRKGEVLGLRRDQVNFDQGIITLTDTKNNERRDIAINETVKATLQAIKGDGPYFFKSRLKRGRPYQWIESSFHQAVEKSHIEDFRFHDLTHTFASNLVMAGEDLNTVAELLGHKGLMMTKRYAHLSPKFKKRAVNILDSVFDPQKTPQAKIEESKVLGFKRK